MSNVDGRWNCTVETPMGEQSFVLSVESRGSGFAGSAQGDLGSRDISDGEVDGDTLRWTMAISKPMPITLSCEATVDGDAISGHMKAGIFGKFAVTGSRA